MPPNLPWLYTDTRHRQSTDKLTCNPTVTNNQKKQQILESREVSLAASRNHIQAEPYTFKIISTCYTSKQRAIKHYV